MEIIYLVRIGSRQRPHRRGRAQPSQDHQIPRSAICHTTDVVPGCLLTRKCRVCPGGHRRLVAARLEVLAVYSSVYRRLSGPLKLYGGLPQQKNQLEDTGKCGNLQLLGRLHLLKQSTLCVSQLLQLIFVPNRPILPPVSISLLKASSHR